jgi:hypothetical protein
MLVDTQKIAELPLSGQIELMEAVMSVLTRHEADFDSPAWHLEAIEARGHELNKPNTWLSFEEVRASLT